ncbi:MAG: hypothetical protein LAT81_12640 [Oceanicaulis sp.]|nr:hypothetical protein [Oceanicaulis sp.]
MIKSSKVIKKGAGLGRTDPVLIVAPFVLVHLVSKTAKGIGLMHENLNPDLVTYGEVEARTSSSQVFYAGVPVPNLFRTPETGAGLRTAQFRLAREIERLLEKMSAHQRLQFYAALNRCCAACDTSIVGCRYV